MARVAVKFRPEQELYCSRIVCGYAADLYLPGIFILYRVLPEVWFPPGEAFFLYQEILQSLSAYNTCLSAYNYRAFPISFPVSNYVLQGLTAGSVT